MSAFQSLLGLRDQLPDGPSRHLSLTNPSVSEPTPAPRPPVLHDVIQQAVTPELFSQHAAQWKKQRVQTFEMLARSLSSDQQQQLKALLEAHAQEHQFTGACHGLQAGRRSVRQDNGQVNDLLARAAADNAALRERAHHAEQELAALKATLPGLRRVIRGQIIAASRFEHPPIPKFAPRSMVNYRHLRHRLLIQQAARNIEEFLASPNCHGYARPEKLRTFLPSIPVHILEHALTHLLLSKRLHQSSSGAYRLRGGP